MGGDSMRGWLAVTCFVVTGCSGASGDALGLGISDPATDGRAPEASGAEAAAASDAGSDPPEASDVETGPDGAGAALDACVATTCASLGFNCGSYAETCDGEILSCWSCTAPQTCGPAGLGHVCISPEASTPTTCGPATCSGCCASPTLCVRGDTVDACGSNGEACLVCVQNASCMDLGVSGMGCF